MARFTRGEQDVRLEGIASPVVDSDAPNKGYVDDHPSVIELGPTPTDVATGQLVYTPLTQEYYIALSDQTGVLNNTDFSNASDWRPLETGGASGAWDSTTSYNTGDIVSDGGGVYVAGTSTSVGVRPSAVNSGWTAVSAGNFLVASDNSLSGMGTSEDPLSVAVSPQEGNLLDFLRDGAFVSTNGSEPLTATIDVTGTATSATSTSEVFQFTTNSGYVANSIIGRAGFEFDPGTFNLFIPDPAAFGFTEAQLTQSFDRISTDFHLSRPRFSFQVTEGTDGNRFALYQGVTDPEIHLMFVDGTAGRISSAIDSSGDRKSFRQRSWIVVRIPTGTTLVDGLSLDNIEIAASTGAESTPLLSLDGVSYINTSPANLFVLLNGGSSAGVRFVSTDPELPPIYTWTIQDLLTSQVFATGMHTAVAGTGQAAHDAELDRMLTDVATAAQAATVAAGLTNTWTYDATANQLSVDAADRYGFLLSVVDRGSLNTSPTIIVLGQDSLLVSYDAPGTANDLSQAAFPVGGGLTGQPLKVRIASLLEETGLFRVTPSVTPSDTAVNLSTVIRKRHAATTPLAFSVTHGPGSPSTLSVTLRGIISPGVDGGLPPVIVLTNASTDVPVGHIVYDGARHYVAMSTQHEVSTNTDLTNTAIWRDLGGSGNGINLYADNTAYEVGDLVISDNRLWRVLSTIPSTNTVAPQDDTLGSWVEISADTNTQLDGVAIQTYADNTAYSTGDIVLSGVRLFRSNVDIADTNTDNPEDGLTGANPPWTVISPDTDTQLNGVAIQTYADNTEYAGGDIVVSGTRLFRANDTIPGANTVAPEDNLGTTGGTWVVISPDTDTQLEGVAIQTYVDNVEFSIGDIVLSSSRLFRANVLIPTTNTDRPEDGLTGPTPPWTEVSPAAELQITGATIQTYADSTAYSMGDIVLSSLRLFRANFNIADTNTDNPEDGLTGSNPPWSEVSPDTDTNTVIADFDNTRSYAEDDIVISDERLFRAIQDVVPTDPAALPENTPTSWTPISGEILAFDPTRGYHIRDLVSFQGELYDARRNIPAPTAPNILPNPDQDPNNWERHTVTPNIPSLGTPPDNWQDLPSSAGVASLTAGLGSTLLEGCQIVGGNSLTPGLPLLTGIYLVVPRSLGETAFSDALGIPAIGLDQVGDRLTLGGATGGFTLSWDGEVLDVPTGSVIERVAGDALQVRYEITGRELATAAGSFPRESVDLYVTPNEGNTLGGHVALSGTDGISVVVDPNNDGTIRVSSLTGYETAGTNFDGQVGIDRPLNVGEQAVVFTHADDIVTGIVDLSNFQRIVHTFAATAVPGIVPRFSTNADVIVTVTATGGSTTGATYDSVTASNGATVSRAGNTDRFTVSLPETSTVRTYTFTANLTAVDGSAHVVTTDIRVVDQRRAPVLSGSTTIGRLPISTAAITLTLTPNDHPPGAGQQYVLTGTGGVQQQTQAGASFSVPVSEVTADGRVDFTVSYTDDRGEPQTVRHSTTVFSPLRGMVLATAPTNATPFTSSDLSLGQTAMYSGTGGLYFLVPNTVNNPVFRSGVLFLTATNEGVLDGFWTLYQITDYDGTGTLGVRVEES